MLVGLSKGEYSIVGVVLSCILQTFRFFSIKLSWFARPVCKLLFAGLKIELFVESVTCQSCYYACFASFLFIFHDMKVSETHIFDHAICCENTLRLCLSQLLYDADFMVQSRSKAAGIFWSFTMCY